MYIISFSGVISNAKADKKKIEQNQAFNLLNVSSNLVLMARIIFKLLDFSKSQEIDVFQCHVL